MVVETETETEIETEVIVTVTGSGMDIEVVVTVTGSGTDVEVVVTVTVLVTNTVDREMDVVAEGCAEKGSDVTGTGSSVTCTIDTEKGTETETALVVEDWAGTELTVDDWSLRVSVVRIVVREVTVLGCKGLFVRVTVDAVGAVYVVTDTDVVVDGCGEPLVTVTVEAVGAVYVETAVVVSSVVDIEGGAQLVVKVVVVVLTEELDVRVSVRVEVVEFETTGTDGCVSCSNN